MLSKRTKQESEAGPSTSIKPSRNFASASTSASAPAPPTLQRLRSGGDAASTLQSSAVAAMGSIRTLASVSSSGTSLHPIVPKRAIKVVLIGDGGCGKTSIRNRFLTNNFFPSYRATIGADFITKTLPIDPDNPDGEKATLQIWDTAGQERFQSLGSAFYRGADAVIIAIDASKSSASQADELERLKVWYQAFMDKAPGPQEDGERRRFCWICAANKSDLIQGQDGMDREKVRQALDGLVERREGEVDWGIDPGQNGERPSGAEEPANPEEVLSRPDPNGVEAQQSASTATPSRTSTRRGEEMVTPTSLRTRNGDASPTASRKKQSDYKLFRKSLSSIAAAAAKSAQSQRIQQEEGSDADDVALTNGGGGGTVNTLYATPYHTMSNLPAFSTSPTATSDITPKQQDDTTSESSTAGGSGFLSSWMTRSKSKASGASKSKPNGRGGHAKRQSIKSIEVFQISDQEVESDASESGTGTGTGINGRFAFPSSASASRHGSQQTPPRSVRAGGGGGGGGVSMKDRQRVDSTMSLNAPSVYHTPRSSTFFSVSPTPRTTLGIPSMRRDDGSIKHGRNQSNSSSLRVDSSSTSAEPGTEVGAEGGAGPGESGKNLKHKPSIASSSSRFSVATTIKPSPTTATSSQHPMLRAPKSINDLFQPQAASQSEPQPLHSSTPPPPLDSPPAPRTPSTISLPIEPPPLLPPSTAIQDDDIETGFTLFYTSAKTGHNIDRMFAHIIHRVVASQTYTASGGAGAETQQEREEREARQAELMRRTIRLASGKNPDNRWFASCC